MSSNATCSMCGAGLPIARAVLGKIFTPMVLNALDLREEKTFLDRLLVSAVGLGVGHVIDKVLAEALGPTCERCQRMQPT
jgi:hypothetical protein